jgi:hypothetical protein
MLSNRDTNSKTVKTLLSDLLSKHGDNAGLLAAIIDRESIYVSDNSRIAVEQVEQVVLTEVARRRRGDSAAT